MEFFNQAMLGKQGWRLIKRPESLCMRVIKGKHYPEGEFLTATRKKRSSSTWKSLLHGREALRKSLVRRIGDGESTDVWNDKWITSTISMKPMGRLKETSNQR